MARAKRRRKAVKSFLSPAISRASSSEVWTVTSFSASARHSSTVRTLEPISRPASQQWPMKASMRAGSTAFSWPSGGRSSSTSTSEYGKSSPRPKPPTAASASASPKSASRHSVQSVSSASAASWRSTVCTLRVGARAKRRVSNSASFFAR